MRELVKSFGRLSWAMSLFGAKSAAELMTLRPLTGNGDFASGLDSVAQAASDQLGGGLKALYETGEGVQRAVLAMVPGASSPEPPPAAPAAPAADACIKPTAEQVENVEALPATGPVYALNLLRFKPGKAAAAEFQAYVEGSIPHLQAAGAEVEVDGSGLASLIGPGHWDRIGVVRYPSIKAFAEVFLESPDQQRNEELRTDALEDSRLYLFKVEN